MSERRIVVVVDPSGAESGARRVNSSLDSIGQSSRGLDRSFGSLGGGLTALKFGLFGVAGAGAILFNTFIKGVREAELFNRGVRQLDATLRATGNKVGYLKGELVAFAEEMEGRLAIPAEDILRTQAALATFDGVAGPIFKRTIRAAADMSAVFGGNLHGNTEKLGTALQNLSEGSAEGLTRGFRFLGTETSILIKKLAETGQTAKAQDVFLSELEKRIGGQGEAAAGGLTGASFRLQGAWNDLLRVFGEGRSGEIAIDWTDRLAQKIKSMERPLQNIIIGFDALMNGKNPDEAVRDALLGVTDAPGSGKVKGGRTGDISAPGFLGGFPKPKSVQEREAEAAAKLARELAAAAAKSQREAQAELRKAEKTREAALERENDLLIRQGDRIADLADMTERLGGTFSDDFDRGLERLYRKFNLQSSIFDAGGIEELKDIAGRVLEEAGYGTGKEIARGFRDEGALAAEALGQIIGGKAGQTMRQAAGLIQGAASGDYTGVGGPIGGIATLLSGGKKGSKDQFSEGVRETFRPVTKIFKEAGQSIADSLGIGGSFEKLLGKATGGAAVGTGIAAISNLVGVEMSSTGAQIGGAIGAMSGIPGGQIIGSIAGGLIGTIGPTARAYSNLAVDRDGNIVVTSGGARGTKRIENKAASAQAAGAVSTGLGSILDAIGGTLRPGATIGTIGPVGDQFGYATTGAVNGSNKSLIKFATAEEAAEAMIRSVFQRGLVQGIDSFTQRVLTSSKSLESAVDLAARYKTALDLIEARRDPIGAAAKDAAGAFDDLIKEMRAFGATTQEIAKIEGLRTDAIKEALDEQLSGLRGFQSLLSGEGSGVTSMSRLTAALADYDKQRLLIGQEGFDQSVFTQLGQQVFGLARDIYGTSTTQFQDIRQKLIGDTSGAISATETAFNSALEANKPVVAELQSQTNVAVQSYQQLVLNNQLMQQLIASLAGGGGANDSGGANGILGTAVR